MLIVRALALILLLVPTAAIAQNAKIDSLKRVIETTKVDTVKGRTLCRLSDQLKLAGKFEEGLKAAQEGLKISRKTGERKTEGSCLLNIGLLFTKQGNYTQALEYFQMSLKVFQEVGSRADEAASLASIGQILHVHGDLPHALDHYLQGLKIYEELGNMQGSSACLGNIGIIYRIQGDYDRALEYYHRSLKISEQNGNHIGTSRCLLKIGNIYKLKGDRDRALEYYERSLQFAKEGKDLESWANCLNNIAGIYNNKGNHMAAIQNFKESLKIFNQLGDQSGISLALTNISTMFLNMGQPDSARVYAVRGLQLAQLIGHLDHQINGAEALYSADSALGNWKSAFDTHQLYKTYCDSLKNDEQSKALGRIEARHESEKEIAQRDLEITKLEADRLRKDLNLKEQRSKYLQDSLTNAEQKALLEANGLRLTQQVKERDQHRQRDSLENASRFERLERERIAREADIAQQRWFLGSAGGGLLLMLVIAFTLFRGRQKEQRANIALRTLNDEIQQQKSEIEAINTELQATLKEVNEQKQEIETQHAKIEDSIRYASRIQGSILPSTEQLKEDLPAHFIHYQPRDIVSGDFYWLTKQGGKTFFAAVDCTGHGVPGAFMSVLGSNLLHQIVDENKITEPDVILSELDRRISATLRQQFGGDNKDGMDLALVVVHEADTNGRRTIEYAGAGRPLWVWSKGEIAEYQSAKYSCGGSQHKDKQYPVHRVEVSSGDRLYIFSDGPVDQFGGPKGRKLGSVQLQAFLSETANLPIEEQGKRFGAFFNDWMSAKKQLDDVLLAGVAV